MEKAKGQLLYGVEVDFEEAKTLANYTLIFQDLGLTVDALKRLRQLLKNGSKDRVLIESYWTAALISYCRCFTSGKRLSLSEDIFRNKELKGDPLGCHRYYINLRNKHVAHSVNLFEQVAIDLQLSSPKNKKREVLGVSVLSQKLICSSIDGVETLLRLSLIAREEVRKKAKEYEAKTLEIGKNLPIEKLYSRARSRITTPGPEDAGKPRK